MDGKEDVSVHFKTTEYETFNYGIIYKNTFQIIANKFGTMINRKPKGELIVFLFSNKNINLILFFYYSSHGAAKSVEISDCQIENYFPFIFSNIGKYQYHCQYYHPEKQYMEIY